MAEKTGGIDPARVDPAAICLAEWIERARGYHNSKVWEQWTKDTQIKLELHNRRQAEIRELVKAAKWALLDHDVARVAAKLNKIGELL